jgi:hypothetical protein
LLTPTIATPFAAYAAFRLSKALPCAVHPPVDARG